MDDDDAVFKALADPTRRRLLDHLFEHDGARLADLESLADMTRFGVMKHLRVLEDAGLVTTRRSGSSTTAGSTSTGWGRPRHWQTSNENWRNDHDDDAGLPRLHPRHGRRD